MNNNTPIQVVSFNYNKVFPSIKEANKELFRGNYLFYKKILKIISGERKLNYIKHPEYGHLRFIKNG